MKLPITGGCACGAIRYEASAEPTLMFNCNCTDCQQASGSPYISAAVFPAESFRITHGALRYHYTDGASGNRHKRGFCTDCGSRISGGENPQGTSGMVGVTLGSLDDASWFRPHMDFWTTHAQPWTAMDPETSEFETSPPV